MEKTFNLCNKLIDIGKGDVVDANIDLYKLNTERSENSGKDCVYSF